MLEKMVVVVVRSTIAYVVLLDSNLAKAKVSVSKVLIRGFRLSAPIRTLRRYAAR